MTPEAKRAAERISNFTHLGAAFIDKSAIEIQQTIDAATTKLREALRKARETIHALHGEEAWELYEKHSPEMKQIDEALKKISL